MKNKYDVIIIGSGIAGMTAAIYLKRGGLKTLIIEQNTPGGQLNKISNIENYPGYSNIDGPTLSSQIYNQVRHLEVDYIFDEIKEVKLNEHIKQVITNKVSLECQYLIIATGRKSKKLFDNDDKYIGKGISYCALCDGYFYKNKDVVVVGGANSAIKEAIYLSSICKTVTMIIRSSELKGETRIKNEVLNRNNIKCMYNLNVLEYNIENNKLVSIKLDNNTILNTDGLFISIGSAPSSEIFEVEKENGFIIVDDKYMTNVENVYACGDVIKKDLYQLITAASEGALVANNIILKNNN